jgi:hypothetical protein
MAEIYADLLLCPASNMLLQHLNILDRSVTSFNDYCVYSTPCVDKVYIYRGFAACTPT